MTEEIKKRIEAFRRGEVPEVYFKMGMYARLMGVYTYEKAVFKR